MNFMMPGQVHRVRFEQMDGKMAVFTDEQFRKLPLKPPYSEHHRDGYIWTRTDGRQAYLECIARDPVCCEWACMLADDGAPEKS